MMTPKELAILAAKALDEKKGKEISAIEITDITTLADYFVIATGSSNTQINALCGSVEKLLEEQAGEKPLRREGYRDGTWVLLDYGCICVHVFSAEAHVSRKNRRRNGKLRDIWWLQPPLSGRMVTSELRC